MSGPFRLLVPDAPAREDNRGSLAVLYESGATVLKRSFSRKGVFRGMHVQLAPHLQTKLIRVISGGIMDFMLDIDAAPKVLHWREIRPGDDWVEIGARFAHGFYALEDTVFEYVCDGGYAEGAEKSFYILDSIKAVLGVCEVTLSDKDKKGIVIPAQDIAMRAPTGVSPRG